MRQFMQSAFARARHVLFRHSLHGRPLLAYPFALAMFLFAIAIRLYFNAQLPPGLPFITFIPAVMVVAYLAGPGPASLAAVLSGFAALYFFVPPLGAFAINSTTIWALGFYVVVVVTAVFIIHAQRDTALGLEHERQINAKLAEHRAFLFRELQHRVANNMAFLVAILSMQKSVVRRHPRASEEVLEDAIRRIRLFSDIHRRLHDPDSASHSLTAHFQGLFDDLIAATGAGHVHCRIDAADLPLSGETLMTLSLIAAELMTNAIKHAFPNQSQGEISIYLGRNGHEILFIVSDNGIGHGDPCGANAGLGCTIVEALCEQLHARKTTQVEHGTHVEICFPYPAPN